MKKKLLFAISVFNLVNLVEAQTAPPSATDQELLKLRSFYAYPISQWDSLRCVWYGECAQPLHNQFQPIAAGSRSTCPPVRRSFGWYSPGRNFSNSYWSVLTDLSYFNYDINPSTGAAHNSSQISNWGSDATVVAAQNNGVKVNLCLKLFNNSNEFATFFGSSSAQSAVIANAVSAVVAANAKGINVDFEGVGLTGTYGTQYINFLASLKSHLNSAVTNSEVSVDLMGSLATASTAPTFLPQLNSTVDLVIMMGYDYYYDGSSATGPVAPTYQFNGTGISVSSDVNSFLQYISLNKFILGIPFYGRTWPVGTSSCSLSQPTTGTGNSFTYSVLAANTNHFFDVENRDPASFNGYSCYLYSGSYKQGFYDDVYSYQKKFKVINERGLAGVAYWELGFDNGYNDIVNVISDNLSSCAVTSCSDTIYDMGGPTGNYHNNEDYTFTISPTNASSVTLTFSSFSLETTNDYLKIYNGTSTGAPLLVTLTGGSIPSAITASSGSMTLQFHSNGSTTQTGYEAVYTCSTGGGGGQADLTATNQSLSSSTVTAGGNLTAYCAEANIGTATASPNVVSVYISADGVLTPGSNGDTYLGYIDIPVSINTGSTTSTYSKSIAIPNGTIAGNYYIYFWADGGQTVTESIDNNNFASVPVTVSGSAQNYTIGTSANPIGWGTTTGGGSYGMSQQATVIATPNSSYSFVDWTEGGSHVTSTASYTFNVTGNRSLVANFSACTYTLSSNSVTIYSPAASMSFWVYTTSDCNWIATTGGCSGMITMTNATGTGNGLVTFNISANTSASPRSCTVTVGGQIFTVTQNGVATPCSNTPSTPTGLAANVGTSGSDIIYVNWNGNSTYVTDFVVERSLSPTGPFSIIGYAGTNFGYFDSAVIAGVTYYYRVKACCNSNCSNYSNVDSLMACAWSTRATSVVSSINSVCQGASVLLTEQGGSLGTGAYWQWSTNGSPIGTGSPITISPITSGSYCVKPQGGCFPLVLSNACTTITVNQPPVTANITANTPITFCAGGSVTLSGNNGGTWSNGSTASSITVTTSGDYFVTNTNVCGSVTSNHILVTANPKPIANAGVDASVCIGNSTQIGSTTAAGNTYSWLPTVGLSNSGISNPTTNPTTPTSYILTVTSSSNCVSKDTVTVTVNANPTINAGNDKIICKGNSISIGPNYVPGNSYAWQPLVGLNDATNASPIANPDSSTIYSVTLTDANGCIATDEVLVTVNVLPIVEAGNDTSVIQGNSVMIGGDPTATGNGSFTYNWSPSANLSSASIANPVASPTSTTTYFVFVTDGNGCDAYDSIIVIVNQIGCTYSLSQNTIVTDSNGTAQPITITCGVSCPWSINVGNCSWLSVTPLSNIGSDSFTVTIPATNDTVIKQCTLSVQGQAISITQYGKVGSVPCIPVDTSVQVNGGCDLAAATISGATYQWYRNGTAIPNATSQYHTANQNGYYHVLIAVGNCIYQSSDHYLTCLTGIEESAISNLKVYPNPTDGTFVINGKAKNAIQLSVNIYNMLGQIVYTNILSVKDGIINEEIRLENLSTGIYHLQLLIDKQSYNQKLLVK